MIDEHEMELKALFGKQTTRAKGKARRAAESRGVSPGMRRAMRTGETKTTQLNLKVTPTFKAQLDRLAVTKRVSLAECVEIAVALLAETESKQ